MFSRISFPLLQHFTQAPCLRMAVKHPTRRLLYTMHRAPCRPTVLTTDLNPTYSCSSSIQSRSMSLDKTPIPGEQPNRLHGSPLVDAEKDILVYHGPIANKVRFVKIFSVGTSITVLPLIYILPYTANYLELPAVQQLMLGGVMGLILSTPLMIHALYKGYVTDLYYNKDSNSFTATTLTFFCRRKITVFTPKDVTFPDVTSPLSFMKVRGKSMYVDPSRFINGNAYNKLMGLY